jgi:hypothetical protein
VVTVNGNVERQKQGDGDDDGRRNDKQLATTARPENQEHRKQSNDTKAQETKLKQDHRANQSNRNGITYRRFAGLTFSRHRMVECA